MLTRTADEWEEFLQASHVPAARVRTMGEALADPQIATRGVIHRHDGGNGIEGGFGVPLAAFTFAHGGPRIDSRRRRSASTTRRFWRSSATHPRKRHGPPRSGRQSPLR